MAETPEVVSVPVDELEPSPFQPREGFDEETIEELASSIENWGLLQPITVRSTGNGHYQIIAGERRWRAAKMEGIEEIPAIVKDSDDEQHQMESLIENIHREDLSDISKGEAVYRIYLTHGVESGPRSIAKTLHAVAKIETDNAPWPDEDERRHEIQEVQAVRESIGKPASTICDWLHAYSNPEHIRQAEVEKPEEERLSGKALARIATIEDEELQKRVYEKASEQQLSGTATSKFVTKIQQVPEEYRDMVLTQDVRVDVDLMGEELVPEIDEDEAERIMAKIETLQNETQEILTRPEVQERGELKENWQALTSLLNGLGSARCPVCDNDHTHLKFVCHDLTVKEAQEIARRQYQQSVQGGYSDGD